MHVKPLDLLTPFLVELVERCRNAFDEAGTSTCGRPSLERRVGIVFDTKLNGLRWRSRFTEGCEGRAPHRSVSPFSTSYNSGTVWVLKTSN